MDYRKLNRNDAQFLVTIFSTPEYEPFFAESKATADDWKERMEIFDRAESYVVFHESKPIGWMMYSIVDSICSIDIIVLLPEERHKGFGKAIIRDLISRNPSIRIIKLDVQKRNEVAYEFYTNLGFKTIGSETQPVGNGFQDYYKMKMDLYLKGDL